MASSSRASSLTKGVLLKGQVGAHPRLQGEEPRWKTTEKARDTTVGFWETRVTWSATTLAKRGEGGQLRISVRVWNWQEWGSD